MSQTLTDYQILKKPDFPAQPNQAWSKVGTTDQPRQISTKLRTTGAVPEDCATNQSDWLRAAWVAYWGAWQEHCQANPRHPDFPPLPELMDDLRCGAKTRAGTPCQRRDLYWSGRCRLHGGLSTGPVTEAGKAQARANGAKGGRPPNGKPKPMKGLTNPHGLPVSDPGDVGSDIRVGAMTASSTETVEVHAQDAREHSLSAAVRTETTSVRCLDCCHISAGFTCLLKTSGQGASPFWAWRVCAGYEAASSMLNSGSE